MKHRLNYTRVRQPIHGFTLIELLVVISIIALLLSILLPALGKAKEQAKKVQCGSHLKSMGLAMHLYATDYDDAFPAMLMPGTLSEIYPGKSHWWQLALHYASNENKVLRCPSLRLSRFPDGDWSNDNYMTGFGLNYNGWNWKYAADWKANDPDGGFGYVVPEEPRGGFVKITRIRRTSNFIMIGDNNDNELMDPMILRSNFQFGIMGPPRALGGENPYKDMPSVHNKGGNIVFTDGHLQWYKTEDLLSDEMLYMWSRGTIKRN